MAELHRVTIDGVEYDLPSGGGGGSSVIPNPEGTPTAKLEKLQIEDTIFNIESGTTDVDWRDISGKPEFANVATSGSYNDLSHKPTSLPASDVKDWAKADEKPTYTASEVGALPSDTHIPDDVTESTVSSWGFTKNTGNYTKPNDGIPKTDLSSDVQTSLGKADTALQSFIEEDPTVPSHVKSITSDNIDDWNNKLDSKNPFIETTSLKTGGELRFERYSDNLGATSKIIDVVFEHGEPTERTVLEFGYQGIKLNNHTLNADVPLNAKFTDTVLTETDISNMGFIKNIPVATNSATGIVKPDGDTITIDKDGTIHSNNGTDHVAQKAITDNWQGNGYNLIPFPYYNSSGVINNGITYTVNADGSVTANGTATAISRFYFYTDSSISFAGKRVRLSGCPSGGSKSSYAIYTQGNNLFDFGDGRIFDYESDMSGLAIVVYNGATVNNLTFYPMLVEVADDGTYPTEYQRYSKGNVELTDNMLTVGDQVEKLEDIKINADTLGGHSYEEINQNLTDKIQTKVFDLGSTLNTDVVHELPIGLSVNNCSILSIEIAVTDGQRYDYYPSPTFALNLGVSLRSNGLITHITNANLSNRKIRVSFLKLS